MLTRNPTTWWGALVALVAFVSCIVLPAVAASQTVALSPLWDYHNGSDYLPETPSTTGGVVSVFANPAAPTTGDHTEFAFWWDSINIRDNALDNWGLAFGRNLNFAVNSMTFWDTSDTRRVTDYQIGLASGGRGGAFGLAYRWSNGDTGVIDRQNAFLVGFIARPSPFYSFGMSGTWSTRTADALGVFDLGIRPIADDRITLFGDYSIRHGENLSEGRWGAGVDVRPVAGLHLGVKFRDADLIDDKEYRTTFSVGVVLGANSFDVLPSYVESDRTHTAYLYRHNPSFKPLPLDPTPFSKTPRYAVLSLENKRLTYQKFRWGDKKRVAWLDLARYLDGVKADPDLDGLVLNLAGFTVRPSIAWELRQKLNQLQAAGKEIVIHGDRMGMVTYYLATVADQLSLDPQGQLMLPGVALQRTYLKGTLEKVGIGFQEFRYFTYKSAAETFSRDSMSDADREQRGRIVDVIYEVLRDGVSDGRGMSHAQYDGVIDDDVILSAAKAQERGLIDQLARWEDLPAWLKEYNGGKLVGGPNQRYLRDYRETIWGPLPKIVVVYAVGECAMDTGIKGRATSKYLNKLAKDRNVAAVVLRADSPGGDPLPSDLVAEGIRKLKAAGKPVIISQGDVAASGGYWISMDGSKILTTPMTITGSIGVIGGWLWDDGLGEKLGLTADEVHRGDHADLFAGMGFPFVGGAIPRRPLNEEELNKVEDLIVGMYGDFVQKVATGRGLEEARVSELGEARRWRVRDAL